MPGSKIPVLEVEKLRLTRDGRGLFVYDDSDAFCTQAWDKSTVKISSASEDNLVPALPVASTIAWLKVTYVSSTAATESTGYIPVFNNSLF